MGVKGVRGWQGLEDNGSVGGPFYAIGKADFLFSRPLGADQIP